MISYREVSLFKLHWFLSIGFILKNLFALGILIQYHGIDLVSEQGLTHIILRFVLFLEHDIIFPCIDFFPMGYPFYQQLNEEH